jgi:hypothetical protein
VLFARGRWAEAEDAFVDAMRRYETAHPAAAALAVGRLAELRVAQGQVEDASAMLVPWYDHPACAHAAAALETAHGELDVAASRLERRIAIVERDPSLLAPLCETLAGVHLARGDRAGARENGGRLKAIADGQQSRMLTAMADATLGAIAVESNTPEAINRLSRALDAYVELAMPYRAGRTQLALARALAAHVMLGRLGADVEALGDEGVRQPFAEELEHLGLGVQHPREARREIARSGGGVACSA